MTLRLKSLILVALGLASLSLGTIPAGAVGGDAPLIADMDIEALLEQELAKLNVDDFYLLEHLIDIDVRVKNQRERMEAVRQEADRIAESFGAIEERILLDTQQSGTVLEKAFEQVVRTYTAPSDRRSLDHQILVPTPKDVLVGAATRGDLAEVNELAPASSWSFADEWAAPDDVSSSPSVLVLLLEELERSQARQAELRENLGDEITALGEQLSSMEESETELDSAIRSLRAELVAINAREKEWEPEEILPETIILPSSAPITSGWGRRWHPILKTMRMHYGTDFDGERGSPVWAAHQGVVETATYMKDFGRVIVLDHGNGFSTLYAHLNKIRVKYGDVVRQGQRIGDIGSTGMSTGPHLHFEMRVDHVLRNPKKYLPY